MNSLLIARNFLKRTLKNKREVVALLILPMFVVGAITLLLGNVGHGEIQVGFVNLDRGTLGEKLVSHLSLQSNFALMELPKNDYLSASALNNGKLDSVLVIPANFSDAVKAGKNVGVELYADRNGVGAQRVKLSTNGYIQTLLRVRQLSNAQGNRAHAQKPDFTELLSRVEQGMLVGTAYVTTGSGIKPGFLQAIGFSIVFMMVLVFTSMGTIMEDKKNLTLARMYVSAIREWEIIAGNLLGSLVLAIIQLIPLVLLLQHVFQLGWGEELLALFILLVCFQVTTIGLGIGLSGFIKEFNPVLIIATVIVPSSILGGCFIPETMLPSSLRTLGWIVPQKWVMNGIEQVLNGAGIHAIVVNVGILLMFGLALATFGLKSIRPLKDE